MLSYALLIVSLAVGQAPAEVGNQPVIPPVALPAVNSTPNSLVPAQVTIPSPGQSAWPQVPPTVAPAASQFRPASYEELLGQTAGGQGGGGDDRGFFCRLFDVYMEEFYKQDNGAASPPPARRALPEPWSSPPFPGHEFQGYPLIGVPPDTTKWPVMKALEGTACGDCLDEHKVMVDGWITAAGNFSTSKNSNLPSAYWIVPNRPTLDQTVLRIHREADTVQQDHIDIGFRSITLYGIDYRYTTAGGWFSQQLLKQNLENGFDPVEQYMDVYIPWVTEGLVIRVGRWIACPDIETQYAPDNYLGSHSLLFTFDTYTQTGVMLTFKMDDQNLLQAGLHAGTDMAPWYVGATPTGFFGWRWVAEDNNDAFYTCLNNINNAHFRHFTVDGQAAGHDNFNYIVSTWTHRFSEKVHTNTEAYFMWQFDAVVGGTPSLGPTRSFGGGGGIGAPIPGTSLDYGILNYTMFQTSKRDYITIRNEWWNDPQGERSGFATSYSSHTIGFSHQFNDYFMVRPEIAYYHSYNAAAFDLGTKTNQLVLGCDATWRF